MAGADQELQFYLAADSSQRLIGGILFQVLGANPGYPLTSKDRLNKRIIMFILFQLNNTKTKYNTIEREALAIVRYLAETRQLIIGNKYLVIMYIDYLVLQLVINNSSKS